MGLLRDKHFHVHNNVAVAPAYPQTIHEHRAPTDESVKILREMEEAARQSILDVYQFEDNGLSGITVLMKPRSCFEDDRVLYVRFTLNGQLIEFEEKIDCRTVMFDKQRAYELLMQGVRNAILQKLIPHIGNALAADNG